MDKRQLVNLCSRSWSLTALGLIAAGTSARVSPLAAAAGCGRTAMSASVDHLIRNGLLERNPGYGHPLRPEYRLTTAGGVIAQWALELDGLIKMPSDRALLRSKWSLPLISCLGQERRYADFRRELVPVTDRALSNGLASLTEHSWVSRRVLAKVSPPAVVYRPLAKAQRLQQHVARLPQVA